MDGHGEQDIAPLRELVIVRALLPTCDKKIGGVPSSSCVCIPRRHDASRTERLPQVAMLYDDEVSDGRGSWYKFWNVLHGLCQSSEQT